MVDMDHPDEALVLACDADPATSAAVMTVFPRPAAHLSHYEDVFVEPVRKLRHTLNDVLDVETNPEREPEEALSILKDAIDTFHEESSAWL